ncbi:MAG: hypothetical protein PHN75_21265, partial [Syntrophales bacterium]|nr:hypothetical protein [Syntrophales bacterium]
LLGKPDGSETEIAAAAAGAGPELLSKIKEAENNFIVKMKELDIDIMKIDAGDRANARDREVKTGDFTTRRLAYIFVSGFFILLFAELAIAIHPTWQIDETTQRSLDITTGVLFGQVVAVGQYYFGSSMGSVNAQKSLRKIAEG